MFRRWINSLTGRVIALMTLGSTISILAMAISILWIFEQSLEGQLDNHLTAYADIVSGVIHSKKDTISVDKANPLLRTIPRHWQIDTEKKHLAKSELLQDWLPIPENISLQPKRVSFTTTLGKEIVAVRQGFEFPNNTIVLITFGLEKEIAEAYKTQLYDQYRQYVYFTLSFLSVIFILTTIIIAIMIYYPLRNVSVSLEAVQKGEAEKIEGQYPIEIANLSNQINQLLAYTSNVIERHRKFSSNLAHALKTPLTAIRNETQSDIIKERIHTMLQVIDRNLSRVHSAGEADFLLHNTKVRPVLERITDSFSKVYQKNIHLECEQDIIFKCEEVDFYEIAGNIIENACKFSTEQIQILVRNGNIIIEDDGPGIPSTEYETVLSRGVSLDQSKPGSGIGLSITQDIVKLYGGQLHLSKSNLGGLRVEIIL